MVTTLAQERVTGIPDTLKEVLSKFGSASLEALMLSGIDVGKTLLLKNFAEGDSKHYFLVVKHLCAELSKKSEESRLAYIQYLLLIRQKLEMAINSSSQDTQSTEFVQYLQRAHDYLAGFLDGMSVSDANGLR